VAICPVVVEPPPPEHAESAARAARVNRRADSTRFMAIPSLNLIPDEGYGRREGYSRPRTSRNRRRTRCTTRGEGRRRLWRHRGFRQGTVAVLASPAPPVSKWDSSLVSAEEGWVAVLAGGACGGRVWGSAAIEARGRMPSWTPGPVPDRDRPGRKNPHRIGRWARKQGAERGRLLHRRVKAGQAQAAGASGAAGSRPDAVQRNLRRAGRAGRGGAGSEEGRRGRPLSLLGSTSRPSSTSSVPGRRTSTCAAAVGLRAAACRTVSWAMPWHRARASSRFRRTRGTSGSACSR
jgi:hypothetical protein